MDYRCQEEIELEVYRSQKIRRYLITTMAGYFPVLLKLQNHDVLSIVRGGDYHLGVRGRLDAVRSRDGGKTWSGATPVVNEGPDDRNPALVQLHNGTILVTFSRAHGLYRDGIFDRKKAQNRYDKASLLVTRSNDNGNSWSEAKPMIGIPREVYSGFGRMVELSDRTILAAMYGASSPRDMKRCSWLYRSGDGGQTWDQVSLIEKGFNETALLLLPSGKLLAALRSDTVAAIWTSESLDNGETWSKPCRATRDGEHPGDLLLLPSGKVLLTYGHRLRPYGVRALLSDNEGHSWDYRRTITLISDAGTRDCGYPSSVLLDNGTIATAYYSVEDRVPHCLSESCALSRSVGLPLNWGIHAALVRYREEDLWA